MADQSQGFSALFNRLCEIAFISEAAKTDDNYTRTRYTNARRLKLQTCLYDRLFEVLQAPWVGEGKTPTECLTSKKGSTFDVYKKLSVVAFQLRLARQFDDADALDYHCANWKHLPGALEKTINLKTTQDVICEPDAILRFIVALSDTGPDQSSPLLGYQQKIWTRHSTQKDVKSVQPEGPLLSTDSHKLMELARLEGHYVHYSNALFERVPALGSGVMEHPEGVQTFEQVMGPGRNGPRSRFFALQEDAEDVHDKKTRVSLFGALAHGHTEDMHVKLGLPDLPTNPREKTFGLSTLMSAESADDEGFHEVMDTSSVTSVASEQSIHVTPEAQATEDIWDAALKLTPQKFYTWEMEGRRDAVTERPYISEAGPEVFDELYNLLTRQVSYLVQTPNQYWRVSMTDLIDHSLHVLIGVPSATYGLVEKSSSFMVNENVRLSGCSPELLQSTLDKLASVGTDYVRVARFISHESQSGGLVLQAFIGGLRSYLQCYRATVLGLNVASVQSPFQLTFTFQSLGKQLRFLSDMCMCSRGSRKPGEPKPNFPTGVKLLTYLYKLALEHSSSQLYPVLLSLLKHSCAPYIMFVQKWVFRGVCEDVFGEFIIEVDDQYLAYRDKHFWTHGFVMMGDDKLDCVPMFLSDLANDIFVCGKSINLMRLCRPEHFLCDSAIASPKMEVTFSMQELKSIDQHCRSYIDAMGKVARNLKDQRMKKTLALVEENEKAVLEERERAEQALADMTDLIDKAKQAVKQKKHDDLKMLKDQMEEAIKQRELSKMSEAEDERKFMQEAMKREVTTAAAEDELKEKTRQELIKYYGELSQEIDRREQRANWQIKRHQLDTARMRFFAQEEVHLQSLGKKADASSAQVRTPVINLQAATDGNEPKAQTEITKGSASVPSPSLVSLIASGVKTDALVHLEARKALDRSVVGDGADSGVVSGTSFRVATPGHRVIHQGHDSDFSEGNTIVSVPSLDHDDDTDISVASNVGVETLTERRRKTCSPEDIAAKDLRNEGNGAMARKTWEAPSDGELGLAESQFPQGHPSESSIQFVMYGDKTTSLQAEPSHSDASPASSQEAARTAKLHPSDSKIQNVLYQESHTASLDVTLSVNTSPADSALQDLLTEVDSAATANPLTGHPSDSSAQESLYPSTDGDKVFLGTSASSHAHPSDSSVQDSLYSSADGDKVSLGTPASSQGHPSDSSAQDSLYPSADGDKVALGTPASAHGYSSDSILQDFLQSISSGVASTRTPEFGHPSNSSLQDLTYETKGTTEEVQVHKRSTHGHPAHSSAQGILYPDGEQVVATSRTRSDVGHPTDSTARGILYPSLAAPTAPSSPRSAYGHPADSSAQDYLYCDVDPTHELRHPQSSFGHPSDSQLHSTVPSTYNMDSVSDVLTHKSRSHWGHPSDSTVEKLTGDISTLSESQQGTRGAPPQSVAQYLIYPDSDGAGPGYQSTRGTPPNDQAMVSMYPGQQESIQGKAWLSTRGHEPAVKIEKLMYPGGPVQGAASSQGHPSDSSAQDSLYSLADGDKVSLGTPASSQGHPSDSSAQDSLYPSADSDKVALGTPASSHGYSSDSILQDFLQSISSGVASTRTPEFGHPANSSLQDLTYETKGTTEEVQVHKRSTHGHPAHSSAQGILYPDGEQVVATSRTRSDVGHPTDSTARDILYPSLAAPTAPSSPRSAYGHPADSSAQDYLYCDVEPTHELRHPQSSFGHPSDSQLHSTVPSTYNMDSVSDVLTHKSRSHWGHPSDSTVEKLTGDISTLSESQQGTRGAPPRSVAQYLIYPDSDGAGPGYQSTRGTPPNDQAKGSMYPGQQESIQGEAWLSTRGHEPAVKIKKLMYPGGPVQEAKPERAKPLEFEDIWLASQVEPLRDNYDVLDKKPTTDLLRGALGSVIEDKEEDNSIDAAQLMSLPILLRRSVTAPLLAQVSLVNKAVVEYFIEDLQVQQHFEVFRKFLFMEDGEFSLSLSDQLFEKLSLGATPRELCSTTVMNGIVTRALQLSVYADKTGHEKQLAFALKWMPEMFKLNDIDTLDFLELRYRVEWPVNIIVTENSIIKYNKVFSFMLRLKRISWVLRNIWFHLKHIGFSRDAAGSPQLRQLQLFRHEMQHFVQNVEGYLSNQILNVTWAQFIQELTNNVRNLDDLHHRHTEYLNKAVFRALLSKKAAPVMKIINDIFSLVLKFRAQLLSCPWQQDHSRGHVVHPSFAVMCSNHKAFKEYSGFLFTVISKLVRRGYQSHLEDFLLRLNFNDFYMMV